MNGIVRLDKRQIEQRIEEDRERHKRLRESIWAVGADEDQNLRGCGMRVVKLVRMIIWRPRKTQWKGDRQLGLTGDYSLL
jgi:hypothetical protein